MDEYKILTEIVGHCLWIDRKACTTYYKFAKNTQNKELKNKWLQRSAEEKDHIFFWEKALELAQKKHLPLIFKDFEEVRRKISKAHNTIEKITNQFVKYDTYSEQLTLAFMLETYMLHPTFMAMFHDYSFINDDIGKNYEKHILSFIDMIRNFKGNLNMLHVDLFCENLYDLYQVTMSYLDNSLRDVLTGLYNRRGFISHVSPILSLAERNKLSIGVIMLDLDNFKSINDTFGHLSGDVALRTEAAIINSCLRESSVLGRYGGDEFIILTDIDNINSLKTICERIISKTEKNAENLAGFPFTISAGAASGKIGREHEKGLAMIIDRADKKLYQAKKKGKNTWAV
jgi:diguanylate cyclase (GGDEF)-like protein